ncbi:oocyte zinc finger protein XlCOF29-like [Phyllobates terribilis]|uniref:oocyte zinc finger protein XlCOF29-like n=1 Tax=Phyllobates terribilis TaxID=111132 RepID=UPI003CCB6160
MDTDKMAERILHLTLEILFRLTGEDYTVVKKTSSERCQDPVSEGWGRPLSPITGPPPHPLIHEDINDQKILELTYKMIELLTGEKVLKIRSGSGGTDSPLPVQCSPFRDIISPTNIYKGHGLYQGSECFNSTIP